MSHFHMFLTSDIQWVLFTYNGSHEVGLEMSVKREQRHLNNSLNQTWASEWDFVERIKISIMQYALAINRIMQSVYIQILVSSHI